ncbi:hypothetical protein OIU78_013094 [Salix suchowensis]|nr:hypothetical protein OIU78_013094 [Salix suchowensis]
MNLQLPFCFCFFLLLQLPFSTNGQAYKNVSLGSSLTAASGDLPWTSPSGEFAFGFQQVGDAGYLLAIWFNKIPERTIVWSANRNNLARRGSTDADLRQMVGWFRIINRSHEYGPDQSWVEVEPPMEPCLTRETSC